MDNINFFSKRTKTLNPLLKGYVVIPWRETPSRVKAFNKLKEWYEKNFPDLKILLCDSGSKLFNLSASRNLGLKEAFFNNADFVVVSDADFFISVDSLIYAIENSVEKNVLSSPYNLVCRLNDRSTSMFLSEDKDILSHKTNIYLKTAEVLGDIIIKNETCSGAYVIPKSVWQKIGGFDEEFVGWGYEDHAYFIKYWNTYKDVYNFIPGLAISVSHKREWDVNSLENSKIFYKKYVHESDY